jgi:hypothetical protein
LGIAGVFHTKDEDSFWRAVTRSKEKAKDEAREQQKFPANQHELMFYFFGRQYN